MKYLIVEDDENKCFQLQAFIDTSFPKSNVTIAKSSQSGLKAILKEHYDLVILDMTMPTYDITIDEDGGRIQSYAGREIIRQIERRELNIPVVVVTQFDRFGEGVDSLTLKELDSNLRSAHPNIYKGSVYYNTSFEGWKKDLEEIITKTV